jgi:hypothetical protein
MSGTLHESLSDFVIVNTAMCMARIQRTHFCASATACLIFITFLTATSVCQQHKGDAFCFPFVAAVVTRKCHNYTSTVYLVCDLPFCILTFICFFFLSSVFSIYIFPSVYQFFSYSIFIAPISIWFLTSPSFSFYIFLSIFTFFFS